MAVRDPYGNYNFVVMVDNKKVGHFQKVSGLAHEIEVLSQQEGGLNDRTHKLPGQGSYPNLTLEVGFVNAGFFDGWHFGFARRAAKRKQITIVLNNNAGKEVKTWNFQGCWPVKWNGPELDASGSDIAVESVEIAHNGLA